MASERTTRFRISDVARIPLRGTLLRLTVVEGKPDVKSLRRSKLRVESPDGATRDIAIRDFATMGGRPDQRHTDRYRMVDVVVSPAEAKGVRIGWMASA